MDFNYERITLHLTSRSSIWITSNIFAQAISGSRANIAFGACRVAGLMIAVPVSMTTGLWFCVSRFGLVCHDVLDLMALGDDA